MATVASLVFEMSANIARLQNDMSKAKQTVDTAMGGIKSAVESAKMALGALGIAATGGAFVAFVKGAIESEAALKHLSERTGQTVEMLSAFRGVAKQSGTDMELVASSAQKLSKNMLEAATGGGKAAPTFAALGIEVRDAAGHLRNSEDVLREVASRLDGMENKTQAVAYAQQMLGKAGANLLPFMHDLAAAGNLNARVTTEQAEAADKFEKQMIKLEGGAKRLGISIANALLPTMNKLLDALFHPNEKVDVPWFDEIFNKSIIKINTWMITLEKGTAAAMRFAGMAKGAAMHEAIAGDLQKGIDKLQGADRDAAIGAFRRGEHASRGGSTGTQVDLGDIAGDAGASGSAKEKNPWYDPAKAAAAREKYLQEVEDAATKAYNNELAAAQATADAERLMFAKNSIEALKAAEERERAYEKAGEAAYAAAQKVKSTDDIGQKLGLTMTSAFENAMIKGKSFRDVLKGIDQDIAQIIIRQSITKPIGQAVSNAVDNMHIGDWFKGIFGGARASGGPVSGGQAYLVGENGPELMVPGGSGNVIPNDQLGGGGGNMKVTINVGSLDPRTAAQVIMANMGVITDGIRRAYNSRGAMTPFG